MKHLPTPLETLPNLTAAQQEATKPEQTGTHWGGPRTTHHAPCSSYPNPPTPLYPHSCPSWDHTPSQTLADCEMQSAVPATLTVWNPPCSQVCHDSQCPRTMARGLFCLAAFMSWPLKPHQLPFSHLFRPGPSGRQPRCWLPATSSSPLTSRPWDMLFPLPHPP